MGRTHIVGGNICILKNVIVTLRPKKQGRYLVGGEYSADRGRI